MENGIQNLPEGNRTIDAGGLSQFYVGYKEQSPVMLLEYTLSRKSRVREALFRR